VRISLATRHATDAFIPLALMYLKASLVGHGRCAPEDVTLLEFGSESTPGAMAEAIAAARPDVVGLSCYVWNARATLAAARLVKSRVPDVTIVLGGPEVGPVAQDVLRRHPYVDAIVYSEGEVPFAEIVRARQAGESLHGVTGICFRDDDGIVDGGTAHLVKELDDYPSPHLERYLDYAGRVVCVETQRGCVFRCNFCFYNKDYSLRNRRFALERVKEELLIALEQDAREIYLMDPVFNLNAARAKEICRFIADHNKRRIPIHSEIWAEFVDDELAALMRQAGFNSLEVGLQTTDETALATTERRLRLERFNEGIGHLRRHRLPFELQLIYGLPAETRATFRESLNFAMSLDPPELEVFLLLVLPGTELWRKAGALDLTFDPEPPYPVRSHLSMTEEDIAYGRRLIKAVVVLQGLRTLRLLSREPGVGFAEVVDEWLAWTGLETPGTEMPSANPETVRAFVAHFCARKGIPDRFYQAFAALELPAAAARMRSATRTTSAMAATP
jgi:anaerobic magnesium-protoporphyrin IX monomethyl ester cyclase